MFGPSYSREDENADVIYRRVGRMVLRDAGRGSPTLAKELSDIRSSIDALAKAVNDLRVEMNRPKRRAKKTS